MIKVTVVDMWPKGDASRSYRLASFEIVNTGSGTETRGDYHVRQALQFARY